MRAAVATLVVLSLVMTARADAAIRYGGDRVVFRTQGSTSPMMIEPLVATAPADRSAVAWLFSDTVQVVTDDRGRLSPPAAIATPPHTPRGSDQVQLVHAINDRGDVVVAFGRFTGSPGDWKTGEGYEPCCANVWVAVRRAGDPRFGRFRRVISNVVPKYADPRQLGVSLSDRGRIAVWWAGELRYTLGRRADRYAKPASEDEIGSAMFDGNDRLVLVCGDGSQATSAVGHHLGEFEWPFGGLGPGVQHRISMDRRGRQVAVWDRVPRDYWGIEQPREVWAAWRRPQEPFRGSRRLALTDDLYGSTYAMGADGTGAIAHTLRSASDPRIGQVAIIPVDTSGHVGPPQSLATGQLRSAVADRGDVLVSWTREGFGADSVPRWRLVSLSGSPTPPAQVVAPAGVTPALGLTRSHGLAAWETVTGSGPRAVRAIHVRRVVR